LCWCSTSRVILRLLLLEVAVVGLILAELVFTAWRLL
jgi:hypothetical protein